MIIQHAELQCTAVAAVTTVQKVHDFARVTHHTACCCSHRSEVFADGSTGAEERDVDACKAAEGNRKHDTHNISTVGSRTLANAQLTWLTCEVQQRDVCPHGCFIDQALTV